MNDWVLKILEKFIAFSPTIIALQVIGFFVATAIIIILIIRRIKIKKSENFDHRNN